MPARWLWTRTRPTGSSTFHEATGKRPSGGTPKPTPTARPGSTPSPRSCARSLCLEELTTGKWTGAARGPPSESPTRASRGWATGTAAASGTTASPGASFAQTPATQPATTKISWRLARPTRHASGCSWTTPGGASPFTLWGKPCPSCTASRPPSASPSIQASGFGMSQPSPSSSCDEIASKDQREFQIDVHLQNKNVYIPWPCVFYSSSCLLKKTGRWTRWNRGKTEGKFGVFYNNEPRTGLKHVTWSFA